MEKRGLTGMGIWNTKDYKGQCNIPGNCLDKRLCSTCFIGGALELGESILDIIREG